MKAKSKKTLIRSGAVLIALMLLTPAIELVSIPFEFVNRWLFSHAVPSYVIAVVLVIVGTLTIVFGLLLFLNVLMPRFKRLINHLEGKLRMTRETPTFPSPDIASVTHLRRQRTPNTSNSPDM